MRKILRLIFILNIVFLFFCNVKGSSVENQKSKEKNDVLELSPIFNKWNKLEKHKNTNKNLDIKEKSKKAGDFVFIYDFFIDENYLVKDVSSLALEKSLVENFHSLKCIYKYATEPITLAIKAPIFDFIIEELTYDEKKIATNETKKENLIDKFLSQKFNIDDQKSILNKLKIFSRNKNLFALEGKNVVNFYNIYKKLDINYEILNSTDKLVSSAYLNSLNIMQYFYLEALVFYNVLWLDSYSLLNTRIMKIIDDEDYIIEREDLEFIKKIKNDNFREAMNFFLNLPKTWSYLVYPYYEPRFDILASNSINKYFFNFKFNVDLYDDASWHVARSFKTINNFYMQFDKKFIEHKYPVGIISSLDYIDKNIQKSLAVRDYEVVINKGDYLEYSPIILRNSTTNKNICLFFENINFDENYNGDMDFFVKNFIKKINSYKDKKLPAIFIINGEKLLEFGVRVPEYFYERLFFEGSRKNTINFISIEELKKNLISVEEQKEKNKIDINEQDFIISNEQISYRLSNEILNNYWFVIKLLRTELDNKKNTKKININVYMENLLDIYKIESNLFLNSFIFNETKYTNLKKYIKDFFNKIYFELNIDVNSLLSKNNFLKNISDNEKVEEFSRIYFYDDKEAFMIEDSLNDDYGDGNYLYPKNKIIKQGDLDIKNFYVEKRKKDIIFRIDFKKSNNLRDPIKNKQIDIYIDIDNLKNSGNVNLFDNRNAFLKSGWDYAISINSNNAELFEYKESLLKSITKLNMNINYEEKSITIECPINFFEGKSIFYSGYSVITFGYDEIKKSIIKVASNIYNNDCFAGRSDLFQSNIIDIILPNGETQKDLLGPKSEIAKLPFIYPKKKEI